MRTVGYSEHRALLDWLDALIRREILRLRVRYELSLDEFRGLYISDQQVDALLSQEDGVGRDGLEKIIDGRRQAAWSQLEGPWNTLRERLELDALELELVTLALAPELHRKYETLYAYLNDDIGRKWATHDLAERLFAGSGRPPADLRRRLQPDSPLYRRGVLRPVSDGPNHNWLTRGFRLCEPVSRMLLGVPLSAEPAPGVHWTVAPGFPAAEPEPIHLPSTSGLMERLADPAGWLGRVVLRAADTRSAREELGKLCRRMGRALMVFERRDLDAFDGAAWRDLEVQARLTRSVLCLHDRDDGPSHPPLGWRRMARLPLPLFLITGPTTDASAWMGERHALVLTLEPLDVGERHRQWRQALARYGLEGEAGVVKALAERFAFTPRQIEQAVTGLHDAHIMRGGQSSGVVSEAALFASARAQCQHGLRQLAHKVETGFGWSDLVLTEPVQEQVRDIAAAIRNRPRVYREWGMGRLVEGEGLKILFAGASGTGKTMTASVLANELGLDLFKINLSTVVSKYIGETERNLDRIFQAAQNSNAILFFDEADALFGKRSEVKDAHDRYANIEVAYLLQKEFDGVMILATNLAKNLDQAFSRRMHYVVDFPVPDERNRERLWRQMLPERLPLAEDIDLPFLARQFRLAGGDIRNIVLSAVFRAAESERSLRMGDLVASTAVQLRKQGRSPSASEFKQYFGLLERPRP